MFYRYGHDVGLCKVSTKTVFQCLNLIALRKTKIAYNFGLSECNRVKKWSKMQCLNANLATVIIELKDG